MPKLICPACMKPVTLPDDFAGLEVTCPSCGKVFDAPAKYTPTVLGEANPPPPPEPPKMSPEPVAERSTPPPGLVPQVPPPPSAPTSAAVEAPALPSGYTRSRGIALSPAVVAWLPVILLTLTFLCTFGAWVGMYVGGYPAYAQGPWSAMVGSSNPNPPLVAMMQSLGNWTKYFNSDWELMLPYLFVLILATALALADRGFRSLDPRRIPPLARVWNWRHVLIVAFATLAFALALTHVVNGFGLERAVRKTVAEQFAAERQKAIDAGDKAALAVVEYREDQEFAKYNLERTSWLYLGLTFNFLAVLMMLLHMRLERRGNKPPPRLVLQY